MTVEKRKFFCVVLIKPRIQMPTNTNGYIVPVAEAGSRRLPLTTSQLYTSLGNYAVPLASSIMPAADAARLFVGVLTCTLTAGASSTLALPTAAEIIAAWPGARVGDCVDLIVYNSELLALELTLAAQAASGVTVNGVAVIVGKSCGFVRLVVTSVTAGAESVQVFIN